MTTKRLHIKEDISEWYDEAIQNNTIFTNHEDMIGWCASGLHTAKVARAAIVSRALGKAPEDLLHPNKTLLTIGAMQDIAKKLKKEKVTIKTKGGKEYEVSAFVGQVNNEEIDPSFVPFDSEEALLRAEKYIQGVIPGHIWGRLLIIYGNNGDINSAVEDLKIKIDELVSRFD